MPDLFTSSFNIPEYTVSELSKKLKRTIEESYGYVRIRGEISGFKKATSGHLYFSLKDESALLTAVCFRNMARLVDFEPENGLEVVASGVITIYEGRSNYQIVVEKLEVAGHGAIMAMLEKRKQRLKDEGLFDADRKKEIPYLPKTIAVVTSPSGAVIQDIIHRIQDRFPLNIMLYPVSVQGQSSADEIVQAIEDINEIEVGDKIIRPDLIIVARGGGSFEDLLPFSEERVVRAVANSNIPIVSAVGHETDTTLIDYASDLRAPTPTAAAEMITPVLSDLKYSVNEFGGRLSFAVKKQIENKSYALNINGKRLLSPKQVLERLEYKLETLGNKIRHNLLNTINARSHRLFALLLKIKKPAELIFRKESELAALGNSMQRIVVGRMETNFASLNLNSKLLDSYHYKGILQRGYAIVRDDKGKVLIGVSEMKDEQRIGIEMRDGQKSAVINSSQ